MFGILLITTVTVLQAYVLGRAVSVPWVRRSRTRRVFLWAGALMTAMVVLGLVFHNSGSLVFEVLWTAGIYWMVILFLTAVALLAVDLVTGFGAFLPRVAPVLRGWALIAGAILSLIACVQGSRAPVVQNYEVSIEGLPAELDGTVIVALTDLHLGGVLGADWMADRVRQVAAEGPDMVVLVGDILEGHGRPGPEIVSVLRELSAPLGVVAVPGNHESFGPPDTLRLEATGIPVLRDAWVEVRPGLVVAGVDDVRGERTDRIERALKGRPAGAVILLSHMPMFAESAARAGVGLMLSGHTHDGQVWPFSYLTQLKFPLVAGRYEVEGMPVIVSRGTGVWGARMRLWKRAEIVKVTLRRK